MSDALDLPAIRARAEKRDFCDHCDVGCNCSDCRSQRRMTCPERAPLWLRKKREGARCLYGCCR